MIKQLQDPEGLIARRLSSSFVERPPLTEIKKTAYPSYSWIEPNSNVTLSAGAAAVWCRPLG